MRSLKLADFFGVTVTFKTSLAGSSVVDPSLFTPHWPVAELKMIVHSFSPGIPYRLYLPAGRSFPSTFMFLLVSKMVASFAPILHTWLYGTRSPHKVLPFTAGVL